MKQARQILELLSLRERGLLILFLWVLLVWWLTEVLGAYRSSAATHSTNAATLETHASWFAERDFINQRLAAAREGVDPANTYNAEQLAGRVDSLMRSLSLRYNSARPSTESTDIFSFHTLRIDLPRASLEELLRVEAGLREFAPYISLSQFQVAARNQRDPRQLNATFVVVAFELNEDALP